MRREAWVLVLILGGLAAMRAEADGCKMPALAVREIPAIPEQRAVIVFKEGQETLIIESSLDGKGEDFAWIIPVPAKPTAFAEVSPGLVQSMLNSLQPIVLDYDEHYYPLRRNRLLFGVVLLWAVGTVWIYPRRRSRGALTFTVLILILFGLAHFYSKVESPRGQELAAESGPTSENVTVEETVSVGNYDLAVLDAASGEALNAWLETNGFIGIPEQGAPIVADYIDKGWRFVAAKLRRNGDGFSRPHPLSMTFPSPVPVYPMRLTALSGSGLYLQLFVVADQGATCPPLGVEYVDQFLREDVMPRSHLYSHTMSLSPTHGPDGRPLLIIDGFRSDRSNDPLAHPAAMEFLWDGCVITKLVGTVPPAAMDRDFALELGAWEPFRQRYYTHRAVVRRTLAWSLGACGIFLLPAVLVPLASLTTPRRARRWYALALPATVIVGLATAYAVQATMTRAEDHWIRPVQYSDTLRQFDLDALLSVYDGFQGFTIEEIERCLRLEADCDRAQGNVYPVPFTYGDLPGGILVSQGERGPVFRIFDTNGSPANYEVDWKGLQQWRDFPEGNRYFARQFPATANALAALFAGNTAGLAKLGEAMSDDGETDTWSAHRALRTWLGAAEAEQAENALRTLVGQPFGRASFLVAEGLGVPHPALTVAACLDALEWLRQERPEDTDSVIVCVCALARAARIPPPMSTTDAAELDAILARAKASPIVVDGP